VIRTRSAALLGMTALDIVDSLDSTADLVRITHTEEPDRHAAAAYARVRPAFAAAQDAVAPIVQSLPHGG